jgi:DNA replication protein DnaC
MLLEPTLRILGELRLTGMAAALERQQAMPDIQLLSFEERFALLLEQERASRDDRRLTRLLQQAKLGQNAAVEDIDLRTPRGLDRSVVMRLATMEWVRAHQTLLVTGATGTGKSYIACALGHAACRQGLAARYYRFSRLLGELALGRANGSYPRLLEKLAKVDLLILDDYGLSPLTDAERRDFLEVLEDRYSRRATLITSQLPLDHWHDAIGERTFADAILDRLVHNAHRLTLKGGSMRKKPSPDGAADPTLTPA